MNKKGTEWPTVLVSTVFSMILLIIGVMMVADVVSSADVKSISITKGIGFNILAARVMNSPACAAWEEVFFPGDTVSYTPHAGIIDNDKFTQDRIEKCMKGKVFSLTLSYGNTKKVISNAADSSELSGAYEDDYSVRVRYNDKFYDGIMEVQIK